ncbi:clathrin light chain B-like isoform X2 [Babylonia areolata]|uniref:clathrin light chain B-like isoform X2 n=1 Tax=Babylonia areolata TaxID=304850 RepID=UPI003FD539EF
MDEFDAFASPQTTEEDPAADFLAREQSQLADIEGIGTSEPAQDLGGFGLMAEDPAPAVTGITEGVEQLGLGLEDTGNAEPFQPEQIGAESSEATDVYSAVSQQDTVRAEPEKLRIWREEHAKRLEAKDAAEDKAKEEWREKAKKELDDWYRHHDEQLQKTKETNREAEEAFVRDRDEKVPGQAWERVTRQCEFNPKNSKNTKDVSRMRSILLQLKQTPLVR